MRKHLMRRLAIGARGKPDLMSCSAIGVACLRRRKRLDIYQDVQFGWREREFLSVRKYHDTPLCPGISRLTGVTSLKLIIADFKATSALPFCEDEPIYMPVIISLGRAATAPVSSNGCRKASITIFKISDICIIIAP